MFTVPNDKVLFCCRYTSGGRRLRLDRLVVVLVKELVPQQLARRSLARRLAAEKVARNQRFTGRPLNLPPTPGMPLAFHEVCMHMFLYSPVWCI